jgi:hypothetical protein
MVKPKQKRVEEAKEALKLAEQSLLQKQASLNKVSYVKSNPSLYFFIP